MGSYSCLLTVSELNTTVMARTLMREHYSRIPRWKLGEIASLSSNDRSILAVELTVARDLG